VNEGVARVDVDHGQVEIGALVAVRGRRWVISDLASGKGPAGLGKTIEASLCWTNASRILIPRVHPESSLLARQGWQL
jgi:hypothetical protein